MGTVARGRIRGVLAGYEVEFRAELLSLGYAPSSIEWKVSDAGRLSRWMTVRGVTPSELDENRLAVFVAELAAVRKSAPTVKRFEPLLRFLRSSGVGLPEPALEVDPVGELMGSYRRWMVGQRELAARTRERYETTARRFLQWQAGPGAMGAVLDSLTARSASDFLLGEVSRGLSCGSLSVRVSELRALSRFLHVKGYIDAPFAGALPPVPGWKRAAVPPRMPLEQVQLLLDSCDQGTVAGIRDFAMLSLLARLGLRASEVAGLRLDDLHWRDGQVIVCGKARRTDRLPVPADVGEAVAQYLRLARPPVTTRVVFVTLIAPHRPLHPAAVSQTVWRQCGKARLVPVRAHALRHALASNLLERGVRLPEIGQLLRHADLAATAVYAKVDYTALRELAPGWTGASR